MQHWKQSFGSTGHCWLTLDAAGSANTLSHEVLAELSTLIGDLEGRPELPGLIIRSGKASGFILGADVREFSSLGDATAAGKLAADGQALLQRIEDLPYPTLALINGYTLGGGLELALACRYRVAIRSYERCIGLPEVQLGIHPGFGGTVRLIEILGAPRALDLMLTGRSLSPVEAYRWGLIDRIASEADIEAVALRLLAKAPAARRAAWYQRLLQWPPLRSFISKKLRLQVSARAKLAHYPAPYAIIDLWQRYGGLGPEAYRAEADSIGSLLVTPCSKNLVRLFLLRERLRNLAPKSASVEHAHIVGAGVMGGDIAAWCALKGLRVTMQDRASEYLQPALKRAKRLFRKRLKAPGAADMAGRRLIEDLPGEGIGKADIIIEAIVEDLDAKRALFRDLESRADSSTILATNTSSIRIEDIASALNEPGRLVGVHFFNPVASMPLVEVIRTDSTDDAIFNRALAFVTRIGKLPLPCRSAPGFLVNRILMPYMLEALAAHEDGQALETIDAAACDFGMPMGPIELADRVGLDVALHVAKILSASFGAEPPQILQQMVDRGRLGKKSTEGGFYRYSKGKPIRKESVPAPDSMLIDRLMLVLINEAAACFNDGIVDDPDLLDAGVVFGTGFAPFTGGPIQYARQCGRENLFGRFQALAAIHGPRFKPHAAWDQLLP